MIVFRFGTTASDVVKHLLLIQPTSTRSSNKKYCSKEQTAVSIEGQMNGRKTELIRCLPYPEFKKEQSDAVKIYNLANTYKRKVLQPSE